MKYVAQLLPLVIALTLSGGVLCGCGRDDAKGPRTRPPPLVAVEPAVATDVPVEARAPVDLRPLQQVDVGSKVLGYVDAVLVDRGDRVKKGQLLAVVRPSDLPEQLAAVRGTLAQAQAGVSLAQANYDRAAKLAPAGLVSRAELDTASLSRESAEATRSAVEAQVSALAVRVGETRITAPTDGVVSQRRLDPGALVGTPQGGAIVTIQRDDPLRVFVAVSERDSTRVHLGLSAYVEVDALPGERFSGTVVRLAPSFDVATRTLDAEVHLDNPRHFLRPGMYGRAAIVLETHKDAVVLPITAIEYTDGKPFAFVIAHGKATRRALKLGTDGGNWMEILSGVAAGEEVVTAGADGLSEGQDVRTSRGVDPFTGAARDKDAGPGPNASVP